VPSEAFGAAGIWRHRAASWNLLAGADTQRVEGTSTDRLVPTGMRVGGGSQWQQGTFVQTDWTRGIWKAFVGARHNFVGTGNRFFSPDAGVVAGRGRLRGRASVYRSFRAPTLNELFRPFRVGNAETQANPLLEPEKLFGVEAGADWSGEHARLSFSFYRNDLDDLITNVTLQSTPELILRQRRNAAEALTRGVDVNARFLWRDWMTEAAYLFADSRFSDGFRIPQVPRHSGSFQLTWSREGTLISAGLRAWSLQYEDDRNTAVLPGFMTLQLAASRRITRSLAALVAIENLADREFLVGYTPVALIGAPRLWRVGLRWDGPLR
jgi:outer membrane receptor protein involved in Fe transport